jgi:hypothetical protein
MPNLEKLFSQPPIMGLVLRIRYNDAIRLQAHLRLSDAPVIAARYQELAALYRLTGRGPKNERR